MQFLRGAQLPIHALIDQDWLERRKPEYNTGSQPTCEDGETNLSCYPVNWDTFMHMEKELEAYQNAGQWKLCIVSRLR